MSNWALELQGFGIMRIRIRGEANILADAPSRAPWENALARNLPIPDMPIRDLIRKMYQDPDGLEVIVEDRKKELLGDEQAWEPLDESLEPAGGYAWEPETVPVDHHGAPRLDSLHEDGYTTPKFGDEEAVRLAKELGMVEVLWDHQKGVFPRFPLAVCAETSVERCIVGGEARQKPTPLNVGDLPRVF